MEPAARPPGVRIRSSALATIVHAILVVVPVRIGAPRDPGKDWSPR